MKYGNYIERGAPELGSNVVRNEEGVIVGVNVALYSPFAQRVEVCFFDKAGESAWSERRVDLHGPHYGVWKAFVPDIMPGQHYGFRVYGEWNPKAGKLYNSKKLLLDPYARAIEGNYNYSDATLGYRAVINQDGYWVADSSADRLPSEVDSAPFVPHGVIVDTDEWHKDPPKHPHIPWSNTVIYEAHVVGLTKAADFLPKEIRGTYAALAHPHIIAHLKKVGITSIELLPIHSAISEAHLINAGLSNYWGYSTLNFFSPNPEYATEEARKKGASAVLEEVRQMVKTLHEAGIEVLLDVVYNHTAEENNDGATLSFKGICNEKYYVHPSDNPGELYDTTGCGNSMNFRNPFVTRLALDSLRYWADEIGVDGFRFDLMVTTARGENGFTPEHPFLVEMKNDPILGNLKLIAEPWDLGDYGWRTGGFGFPYSEWNDSFRNAARTFWVADKGWMNLGWRVSSPQDLATRLAGSRDVFGWDEMRGPISAINYITAHDGFTMRDLVTYNEKHNDANGEGNRDGSDNNLSFNHGVEGDTLDRKIGALRRQTIRNLLGTLLLSSGVPMITAGDELGRTQFGNNNAYCQNSPISWLDWNLDKWQNDLVATTRHLIEIRQRYPALRRTVYFTGTPKIDGDDIPDIGWYRPDGAAFDDNAWQNSDNRAFQVLFERVSDEDEDILILINGNAKASTFNMPNVRKFRRIWNSKNETPKQETAIIETIKAAGFSIQVFASVRDEGKM